MLKIIGKIMFWIRKNLNLDLQFEYTWDILRISYFVLLISICLLREAKKKIGSFSKENEEGQLVSRMLQTPLRMETY